jgi:hypothetical protein
MVWREVDGPRVTPPTRAGFGTRLIERGLANDLNGEVRITYPADGVVCIIRARLDGESPDADEDDEDAPPVRRASRGAAARPAEGVEQPSA